MMNDNCNHDKRLLLDCCQKKKSGGPVEDLGPFGDCCDGNKLLLPKMNVSMVGCHNLQDIKGHMIREKYIPLGARQCKKVEFLYSDSDDDPEGR